MKTKTYKLTDEEIMFIAERELASEHFFQDGECTLEEAKANLDYLLESYAISRITYDYYKKWENQ